MAFLTVADAARLWDVSERTVRNYCADGRIPGAELIGKTWAIPEGAERPGRRPRTQTRQRALLDVLREEKAAGTPGGIYHHIQVDFAYNSNHIEGSRLTHEQTRLIFETNTIGVADAVRVDDILETFAVGDYKRLPNEVGGRETTAPEEVASHMAELIERYETLSRRTLEDIVAFHAEFEAIHPFQDGNGRVGRLVMFKECLRNGITPFIITDEVKLFYYRGLSLWRRDRGYLLDTCHATQDAFSELLGRFRIEGQDANE